MGILDRLGVKVLGTPIRTLEVSEDRDLFCQALNGKQYIFISYQSLVRLARCREREQNMEGATPAR